MKGLSAFWTHKWTIIWYYTKITFVTMYSNRDKVPPGIGISVSHVIGYGSMWNEWFSPDNTNRFLWHEHILMTRTYFEVTFLIVGHPCRLNIVYLFGMQIIHTGIKMLANRKPHPASISLQHARRTCPSCVVLWVFSLSVLHCSEDC